MKTWIQTKILCSTRWNRKKIKKKQQFSVSVADFDFFFMIISVFYENVYTGSICTFYMLI